MSQTKLKPKATVKSVIRDADKMYQELTGINEKLKAANNQLIQAHMSTHAWVKSLEERITRLEKHTGILPVTDNVMAHAELVSQPSSDGVLEGPSEEVIPPSQPENVILENLPIVSSEEVDRG